MNNFSNIVNEVRKNYDSETLLKSEITKFINKVNKVIPSVVKDVIYLTNKYNLLDRESIEEIKNASKGSLKKLSDKYNIDIQHLEDFWKMLKDLKNNINLLPQYMSAQEREMLELGKLSMDDLTIDLDSPQGRNAAAKIYMPLVYKIVTQYTGKSGLSKPELISAGTLGLTSAMNDWDGTKGVPFKTYAGNRIRQQILNDINSLGHTLSGFNDYAFKQGYSADASSLDSLLGVDDSDFKQDRLAVLGFTDDEYSEINDDKLQPLYDLIEKKFNSRDVDIFYRFFALKGNKKEKSKDIAKFYGMSEGNIRNSIINKIIKFLRTDKQANKILSNLQESYSISLMVNFIDWDKASIIDSLANDDLFILLEEINKWTDRETFNHMVDQSLSRLNSKESLYIMNVLQDGFKYLDDTFKKNKKIIILFLNNMYPTEPMNKKTDVGLIEYMLDICDAYQKFKS